MREKTQISLLVNGKRHQVYIEPRYTLLDVLRKHLGLTGTKKGCDEGSCGAYPNIIQAAMDAARETTPGS